MTRMTSLAARWMRHLPAASAFVPAASALALLILPDGAHAHPHVWVTMRTEIIYAADGTVTGVRHAWTFDEMFSTFATQGFPQAKRGTFTRQELAPLAEVNVSSLKEYGYFTRARAGGKKAPFVDPVDYWLDYDKSTLTLHFTLPLKAPANGQDLAIDIYDPTWFVDFGFAEKNPVALVGAPATCKRTVVRPGPRAVSAGQPLSEDFFNSLTSTSSFGQQLANKVFVKCPNVTGAR